MKTECFFHKGSHDPGLSGKVFNESWSLLRRRMTEA